MKRFWVFVIICVVALGVGFTVFRFMSKEEILYLNQTVYEVNNGENFTLDIVKKDLRSSTEITVTIEDRRIVQKTEDPESYTFKAVSGGETVITVSSNMPGFNPVNVFVKVGDGNYNTPYLIKTYKQLKKIGVESQAEGEDTYTYPLNASYKLISNIGIEDEWKPIGEGSTDGFTGNFWFNGKTISNMTITSNSGASAGLFAKIGTNGYVRDAKIVASSITSGSTNVGTLAGENYGTIENAIVSNTSITNTTTNANVGGLVGKNCGTITKSQVFEGTISASGAGSNIGGFAGLSVLESTSSNTIITRSSAECTLATDGVSRVGGLVGYVKGSTVENCYAGSLTSDCVITSGQESFVGGVVGVVEYASFGSSRIRGNIADTYSAMQYANATSGVIGGIIGKSVNYNSDTLHNIVYGNYYSVDLNPGINGIASDINPISGDDFGVYGKTTDKLKQQQTYESFKDSENIQQYWQFAEGVWTIEANTSLPALSFEVNYVNSRISNYASPTDITNGNFVEKLSNADSQTKYILKQDIHLSSENGYVPFAFNGKLTCPLGEDGNPQFTIYLTITSNAGVADGVAAVFTTLGANAELTYIKVCADIDNVTTSNHVAALAGINNGIVSSCTATCATGKSIKTDFAGDTLYIAGLIAENRGKITGSRTLSDMTIRYSKSPSTLFAGGITGYSNNYVADSTNNAVMQIGSKAPTGYVGGVVGYTNAEVNKCANHGMVSGEIEASGVCYGGVVGCLAMGNDASIKYSANYSNVSGSQVGGIVGITSGSIEYCYSGNAVLSGKRVGGLAYSIKKGYIKNSMTDKTNIDASETGAGVCYSIDVSASHNAFCQNVFSSCYFGGTGSKYYETPSNIRGGYWDNHSHSAIDENAFISCINVARSGDIIRSRFQNSWAGNYNGLPDIQISDDQATGTDGNYQIFASNNYSKSVWKYDDETKGGYIRLLNIAR